MTQRQILRVSTILEVEKPIETFARLNIKHDPNTETMVQELPHKRGEAVVEVDLTYCDLNEKWIEKAWLDLIFEGPEMNQITLRDVTLPARRNLSQRGHYVRPEPDENPSDPRRLAWRSDRGHVRAKVDADPQR